MIDYRLPEYRESVFQDFFEFHLKYRSHPGAVYYVAPWLAEAQGWGEEQKLWWAIINGNTQNPVTTWLLMRAAPEPSPEGLKRILSCYEDNYARLEWDTDRRHHKPALAESLKHWMQYGLTSPEPWREWSANGWQSVWAMCQSIHSFGRLSAWSFSEYLRIFGYGAEPDTFLLEDMDGSRSHRTGLAYVTGAESLLDSKLDTYIGDRAVKDTWVRMLNKDAERVLADAHLRAAGKPWAADVGRLTMESTLCTYKSWHRPRRRYPNVYNDLLHDRIKRAETRWPNTDFADLWNAREASLPKYLRLECCPNDPGAVALKQDWYRLHGTPIMMSRDYQQYDNPFDRTVWSGA